MNWIVCNICENVGKILIIHDFLRFEAKDKIIWSILMYILK